MNKADFAVLPDISKASPTAKTALEPSNLRIRKRPYDSDGDSEVQARERRKKRPRIERKPSLEQKVKELQTTALKVNSRERRKGLNLKAILHDESSGRISFPRKRHYHSKVSKAIKLFASCISYPQDFPAPKRPKQGSSS